MCCTHAFADTERRFKDLPCAEAQESNSMSFVSFVPRFRPEELTAQ